MFRGSFLYNLNMDEMEKLYTKTLLWAYERHQEGFTLDELRQSIGLTDEQWVWWREMFITTNGNGRKLIDLYQRGDDGNAYRYTLNDKGMAVVLEYLELQEARVESQKANKRAFWSTIIAIFSLVVAIISIIVTTALQINSNNLTQQGLEKADASLQLAVEPQAKIYLEKKGEDENFYIYDIGIESIGVVPLTNLSGKYTAASVENESGKIGLIFQESLIFEKIDDNLAVARVQVNKIGNSKIKALIFDLEYQRGIDKKIYTERPVYIIDDFSIYLPEQARTVEKLKATVEKVNEYTTQIMPDRVYWQEI